MKVYKTVLPTERLAFDETLAGVDSPTITSQVPALPADVAADFTPIALYIGPENRHRLAKRGADANNDRLEYLSIRWLSNRRLAISNRIDDRHVDY